MAEPREYGPHDESHHAARMMRVTVGSFPWSPNYRKYGDFREYDTGLPTSLLKQIRAVNALAYDAGQEARRRREAARMAAGE